MGLALSPDEAWLVSAASGTHELLVYRMEGLPFQDYGGPGDHIDTGLLNDSERFYRIPLGGRPMAVRFARDGRRVFVANYMLNAVQVVDRTCWCATPMASAASSFTRSERPLPGRPGSKWFRCASRRAGARTKWCRAMRPRPAPMASLMAISRRRVSCRAISKPDKLTQPITSRHVTAASSSRGSVALVRCASAVIRSVRSGASESIASTKYSKWVRPESRRSWESSTPGSSSFCFGEPKRVEVRYPDPAANPYLAFAAMMMAGLDGIQNKLHPGDPIDKNLYDLPPEIAKSIPHPCASLEEALDCLDKDREFLTRGGVFSNDMIDAYMALKMEEVTAFRMTTHPLEFQMYYSL